MTGPVEQPLRSGRRVWLAFGVLGVVAACIVGVAILVSRPDKMATATAENDKGGEPQVSDEQVPTGPPFSLFEDVSAELTGVRFTHRLDPNHPRAYLYHSGYACGGVALGDVNGDGLADIFLVSGPDDNSLFLNKGDLTFERSIASATIAGGGSWGVSANMVDVDGDGDLDIFLCNYDAPNRLWLNDGVNANGELQLTECGPEFGLSYAGPSLNSYFSDFDGDGDLDLFLLTNRVVSPKGRPNRSATRLGPDGKPQIMEKYARHFRIVRPEDEVPGQGQRVPAQFVLEYGHPDRLFRNDGPGKDGVPRFVDVTDDSGFGDIPGHGLSALIWDINHDGRPDIYVANDYTDPDRLWLNMGPGADGKISFRDATDEFMPYTTWYSMGSDLADMDGDGRLDFLVADMAGTTHFKAKSTMAEMSGWQRWVMENGWPRQAMRNMLFLDSEEGRFREVGLFAGVAKTDWTWGVKLADFDLDGRNDLFVTNGSARTFSDSDTIVRPAMLVGQTEWDIFRDKPEMRERNLAYRNRENLDFENVSRSWNLDKEGMSYASAVGDLDGDGDLDLVVCNLNDEVSIYRNRAEESGAHWLRIRLEGEGKNRFGLGALVTVKLEGGASLVRLMNPQTGFLSVNEPILHFGLAKAQAVDSIEVRWPGGQVQRIGPRVADQLIVIREQNFDKPVSIEPREEVDSPRFIEVAEKIGLDFKHEELPFNDYRREFLLPGKLSQFGSGIAVADINSDGLDDIFVGGAAGQAGALFRHQADHSFFRLRNMPWLDHAGSEDMGVLFFDADRDGDLDLYVAQGSNQWQVGDARYADHLYLNKTERDGRITFTESSAGSLPEMLGSGSCVVGADYDRDGDVDLFVGARSVPGQYPVTPTSTLLRNDSEKPGEVKFTNVTKSIGLGDGQVGLVTAAIWSDVDGDHWPDLLVTCEWGTVRLYLNHEGQLVESTAIAGLGDRLGWWNAITGADFDGDGDIDYAVLNVGSNTKYGRATAKKPVALYRGDMDKNGVFDLVEAKSSPQGELPVRGRSCSSNAMPLLRKRFPTYKGFALANLTGIYTEACLNSSDKVTATEFESGVWVNQSAPGKPRFTWQSLPLEAQFSPCFGTVAADFFGDGRPSLAIAQNLYSREPETGLWRGGLGCMFRPSAADEIFDRCNRSGFVIAGDGKGLALADLNADGRPDIIASQNNDSLLAFLQTPDPKQSARSIVVRLAGPAGNPLGFGATITLLDASKVIATTEIHGGSGYLSQSVAAAFFVRPADTKKLVVRVNWPTGEVSVVPAEADVRVVIVPFP